MKQIRITLRNAWKAMAFVGLLTLGACGGGVSSAELEATKANLNNNPQTPPGTPTNDPNAVTVNPTNATNPQASTEDPANATTMQFEEKDNTHDFGNVKAGEKVKHVFKFKNTGNKPLTITDAKGSCGCTVPEYPKEPIAPGKTGEINVQFDSNGKSGNQTKYVTLTANTLPAETKLTIKASVVGGEVKTK